MKSFDRLKITGLVIVCLVAGLLTRAQDVGASTSSETTIDHKSLNYFMNDFCRKKIWGSHILVEHVEALRDVVKIVKYSERWLNNVQSFAEKTGDKRTGRKAGILLERLKNVNITEVEQEMNASLNIGRPYFQFITINETDGKVRNTDLPRDVASRHLRKISGLKKELMKFSEECQTVLDGTPEGKVIAGLFPLSRHKANKTEEIIFTPTIPVEKIAYNLEMMIYTILKQNNNMIEYNIQVRNVIHVSTFVDSLKESGAGALQILKKMYDDYETKQIPIYENMLDLLNKMNEDPNAQTVGDMKAFIDEHLPKIYGFFWEKYLNTAYLYKHHIQPIMAAEGNVVAGAGDALRYLLYELNSDQGPFPFPEQSLTR
ncbi:hypothetical protein [Ereboglobus luteus]|uniref:Uncharacterized protein n=1 Tax=Ereboglobus luteus TaxID=1796921 RepID=A0A2U8E3P8_9BACT|nr:hypothetical protein [Ereboglobus luteus]AWI09385.1 hypothetical protein CKA38_09120 [Ereboglobus luteus]